MDDPVRAVLGVFDAIDVCKQLGLTGRFGITNGNIYCGLCGCPQRQEYTVPTAARERHSVARIRARAELDN